MFLTVPSHSKPRSREAAGHVAQTDQTPHLQKVAQRGFSIMELVGVCAILLILASMMVPSILVTMRNLRMRTSAMETAALLQQARLRAIRTNSYVTVRAGSFGTTGYAYMDTIGTGSNNGSGNGSYDAGEILDQMGTGVKFKQTGNPAFDTATLLGYTPQTNDYDLHVSWNQRGMPCLVSGSVCLNPSGGQPVGFLYFLNDGGSTWSAVSVSPAGRIKTWMYTGSTWK